MWSRPLCTRQESKPLRILCRLPRSALPGVLKLTLIGIPLSFPSSHWDDFSTCHYPIVQTWNCNWIMIARFHEKPRWIRIIRIKLIPLACLNLHIWSYHHEFGFQIHRGTWLKCSDETWATRLAFTWILQCYRVEMNVRDSIVYIMITRHYVASTASYIYAWHNPQLHFLPCTSKSGDGQRVVHVCNATFNLPACCILQLALFTHHACSLLCGSYDAPKGFISSLSAWSDCVTALKYSGGLFDLLVINLTCTLPSCDLHTHIVTTSFSDARFSHASSDLAISCISLGISTTSKPSNAHHQYQQPSSVM